MTMIPIKKMRYLLTELKEDAMERLERKRVKAIALPDDLKHLRVAFVGASVARMWHLDRYYPQFNIIPDYRFNKSEAVEKAIALDPNIIIIKECAAYFPHESLSLSAQQDAMKGWIQRISEAKIQAAMATVVPVTHAHNKEHPNRLEMLQTFNKWIRSYGKENGIPVLDLAIKLQYSHSEPQLMDAAHTGDGLHLNRKAYGSILTPMIPEFLYQCAAK